MCLISKLLGYKDVPYIRLDIRDDDIHSCWTK